MHAFDEAIVLESVDGIYLGKTHPKYANMVGPFGGLGAALLIKAALLEPESDGAPIAATFNFTAPIKDGDFTLKATPVRLNRSTQHWLVELIQEDSVCLNATIVMAKRRETFSETEASPPKISPYDALEDIPSEGKVPWIQNYRVRVDEGGFEPFFNQQEDYNGSSRSLLWAKDYPDRNLDFASLTALCDIFFPRVFVKRQKLMPIGTISMTIHFHMELEGLAEVGSEPVLGVANASAFNNGFFDQTAEVWSSNGRLLATTSQMVYFKDSF